MSFLLGLTNQKSKGHLHLKLVNFLFVYMFLQNTDNNHDLRLASARPKLVILRQFQNPQRWLEWQWNSLKCFKASDVHQAGNGKAEKQRKKIKVFHFTWIQGGVEVIFCHGCITIKINISL